MASMPILKLLDIDTIPLYTCVAAFTWVCHEYWVTLEDEIHYIWPSRWNIGKVLYYWIRIFTLIVTTFDVAQVHSFYKFKPSIVLCVAMDPITRTLGALSLWSIEAIMQMRIYALYDRSHKVVLFNGVLFAASIAGFVWIMVLNASRRAAAIQEVKMDPLVRGCPSIHTSLEYLQWIPATAFEGILFLFALFKTCWTMSLRFSNPDVQKVSLYRVVVRDNLLYFFGIACVLVLNNLMVVRTSHIPWFSFGPFHASMGIMTIRLILHLHKAMHRLQNMSNPGSAIYMSDRTGPITFRVEHDAGSDDEDDEDDDEDEDELLHNHGEVLEITIAAPTMRQRSIDIDNDTVR